MLPSEFVAKGWCQYSPMTASGEVCAYHAVYLWDYYKHRKDDQPSPSEYRSELLDVIGGPGIVFWNDDPRRTKSEVVETLQQVERKLKLVNA